MKMLRYMSNVHPFQIFLKHLAGVRRIVQVFVAGVEVKATFKTLCMGTFTLIPL
jgi:hypothetical protein